MDIYIKPAEKIQAAGKREVVLGDAAEVFCSGKTKDTLEKLVVFRIPETKKQTYLLSVLELIRVIRQAYPEAAVCNVGASDILIEYLPEAKKPSALWTAAKAAFLCLVLFAGGATTVMCFHSDTQLPLIFQNYYAMFFGETAEVPLLLSLPYSVGLGLGVILFFNHFSRLSVTEDPTPIEMEMSAYEKEMNASIIDRLDRQKRREH